MEKRIIFNSEDIRGSFFKKVIEVSDFSNWDKLKDFLEIQRSSLSSYRNGKLTIPEKVYNKLILKFKQKDKNFFNGKISRLEENWGRIKAGKITYSKHKTLFDAGREKAIKIAQDKTNKFDINMPLSEELAYFIGLFIGDGFTNKYQRYYLIQFTGDKRTEKNYYKVLVSKYSKQLFNLSPKIREEKNGDGLRFNLYSKQLFNLITQRFNISPGRKSRVVLIPKEILKSGQKFIISCISGIYDAEGCVFFDKRATYKKSYPRIDMHMLNSKLIKQIFNLLKEFSIPCSTNKDGTRILIYGVDAVKKFIKEIGFLNPKHLDKLKSLKV